MALIGMHDVSVGFGGPPLLEHMHLQIEAGERICLIGRNGVGKSTLMKLFLGEIQPQSGDLTKSPSLKVAKLAQTVPSESAGTVFDQVSVGLGAAGGLVAKYHELSHRLATESHDEKLMEQLDKTQQEIDAKNAWQLNVQVETIIEKMSLDPDAQFASLSAGMKRRVLLAQAMASEPDLLLLDEPTNHLDIEAIAWIEDFLLKYPGTLVFVSHDRAFLKKLSTRILELDRGQLTSYTCNYETYLERKEAALQVEATENKLFDKKLAQEEVWIRKGIQARRTRNEGRVRALKKMRKERSERKEQMGTAMLQQNTAQQSGRLIVEAKKVHFSYEPDKPIIKDLNVAIMRGDKIGIIGPNGSGKTTLLRVLLKELEAQSGTLRQGVNLEIAYFDQLHAQLDENKTVYENISDGSENIMINGRPKNIVGYLQDFLFTPTQSRNPVSNLSGGERNRLLLARLFMHPSNVLVLDEPTNDLDIETLDLLEEFVVDYPGSVLMVSHDREFLNNTITSTLALEGDGVVKEYVGGYDDWLRQSKKDSEPVEAKVEPKSKSKSEKEKVRKITYKEQKELEALPALIEDLENKQATLHETMADPDFYKQGSDVAVTTEQLKEITQKLESAYARWEELETLPKK